MYRDCAQRVQGLCSACTGIFFYTIFLYGLYRDFQTLETVDKGRNTNGNSNSIGYILYKIRTRNSIYFLAPTLFSNSFCATMVKPKTKLWCKISKIHSSKTSLFGTTYKVSVPGVERLLAIPASCLCQQSKEAFEAGESLPKSAKARVNRGKYQM